MSIPIWVDPFYFLFSNLYKIEYQIFPQFRLALHNLSKRRRQRVSLLLLHVVSYQFRAVCSHSKLNCAMTGPQEFEKLLLLLSYNNRSNCENHPCYVSVVLCFGLPALSLSLISFLLSRSTHAIPFLFLSFAAQLYKLYSSRPRCRGDICQQLGCWPKSQASIWSTWRQSLICFRFESSFPFAWAFLLDFLLFFHLVLVTRHLASLCIFIEFARILYMVLWSTALATRRLHNFPAFPETLTNTHRQTQIQTNTQMMLEVVCGQTSNAVAIFRL